MTDIVERLREFVKSVQPFKDADLPLYVVLMTEAADEIEPLRGELDKAHRLVGQSIQWQRDALLREIELQEEIAMINRAKFCDEERIAEQEAEIERLRALVSKVSALGVPGF